MRFFIKFFSLVFTLCMVVACDHKINLPSKSESEDRSLPGGKTTVRLNATNLMIRPAANMPVEEKPMFYAGKALANQPWVKAPTATTARDGLGPIYNARSCLACHKNGGRGKVPNDESEVLFSALVRLSLPGHDKILGVIPEPNYGDQIQPQSIALKHQLRGLANTNTLEDNEVQAEAKPFIQWQYQNFVYPDGQTVQLRKPDIYLKEATNGNFHPKTLKSLRVAQPLLGVGLLEAISQSSIDDLADPLDLNNDGISGKTNQVWDFKKKKTVAGRFGLKATRADLYNFTAAAFANDIGITNSLFPNQPCRPTQTLCNQSAHGNDKQSDGKQAVELPDSLLQLTTDFVANIGIVASRNVRKEGVIKGQEIFYKTGCQSCHQPSFKTGESSYPHLSSQTIWPFSDLLLHDMGEGLSDGRPDYLATGREWRTAPLWGVGLAEKINGNQNYLHDGRALTIEQAILWHGGEAKRVRKNFVQLKSKLRNQLVEFVKSL